MSLSGYLRPRRQSGPAYARGASASVLLFIISALLIGGLAAYLALQPSATPVPEQTRPASRASASVQDLVTPLAERLAANPDDPSSWVLLGKSYDYLGNPEQAAQAYRQAIRYGNTDPAVAQALRSSEDAMVLRLISGPVSAP